MTLGPLLLAVTLLTSIGELPPDFRLHPETHGGAGGGAARGERAALRYYPVIMIPDDGRDHRDWQGAHPGNAPGPDVSVYRHLESAGFQPIELWMLDPADPGRQWTSIEEATDDLKFFIASVMHYTGADRVQILAHGAGAVLARLTLLKYNIAHWVASEVYIGFPAAVAYPGRAGERALRGFPNAWVAAAGSPLLREVLLHGNVPALHSPLKGRRERTRTLTIHGGNGPPGLRGTHHATLSGLDRDGLRCAPATARLAAPFLKQKARPYDPAEDRDGDGFRGAAFGGPDTDDTDPSIYPGAPEIRGDGIDQDGNGRDLDPEGGRDGEIPLSLRIRRCCGADLPSAGCCRPLRGGLATGRRRSCSA